MPCLISLIIPTLAFSAPPLYKRMGRLFRDILRFSLGCCIALGLWAALTHQLIIAITSACILFVFWRIYFAKRRSRKAEACNGCPELEQPGICSGCRLQAEGIRAYETEATALLLKKGGLAEYSKP